MIPTMFRAVAGALALVAGSLLTPALALAQATEELDERRPGMLDRGGAAEVASRIPQPGDTITAYRLAWQGDEQALARRVAGALETLVQPDSSVGRLDDSAQAGVALLLDGEQAGTWVRLADSPVLARYDQQYDELRLIHEDWDALLEPEGDIGVDGAQEVAEHYLSLLAERGSIDARLFADVAVQLGYKVVGEGPTSEKVADRGRIVEYRITFRPRLDGFELLNAGVRLGILASGQLANLRAGGVTPAGEWRDDALVSDVEDAQREVVVSVEELRKRFLEEELRGAEVDIAWDRVAYVMPDGVSEAVVEPMWVVSFSRRVLLDGAAVVGRRETLAYSLTEPGAPPLDLSPAEMQRGVPEPTREP